MAHFDRGSWTDYLRGLVGREAEIEMTRHLEAGCTRCEPAVAAFSRVGEVAAADARMVIAPGAIRSAKALFAVRQADRLPASQRLCLEPVLVSVAAGLRSNTDTQRFTCSGGGLELGLVLDSARDDEQLAVSGELLHRRRGHLAGVPAFLLKGQEVVDQATTDELGSFRLAAEPPSTRLCIFLEDDRLIELALAGPDELTGAWTVQATRL